MEKLITGLVSDEERALYNLTDAVVESCSFAGEADGESALKESRSITVKNCNFELRYPLWHTTDFKLIDSKMSVSCRAPLWYSKNGVIDHCEINGVKCLRECENIEIKNTKLVSTEFGWKCRNIHFSDCDMESEYFLFMTRDTDIERLRMNGKYSFQYTENLRIKDSELNTKDAFWHCKNVTVENSVINGEYLAWYSDGLTLINCKINGTQPLCYCRNLRIINCTMENADLSFEYSDVRADINGSIVSVKNPHSGYIKADSIGEVIIGNSVMENNCRIITE